MFGRKYSVLVGSSSFLLGGKMGGARKNKVNPAVDAPTTGECVFGAIKRIVIC